MQKPAITIGIFLLDDDEDYAYLLSRMLTSAGLTDFKIFTSVEEFFTEITAKNIFIAVIDHLLGEGLTGFMVMQKIFAMNKQCSVIIMSHQEDMHVPLEYWRKGAAGYIDKGDPDFESLLLGEISKEKTKFEGLFDLFNRTIGKLD